MSGYKNFAVIGAGNIGAPILEELLNAKSTGAVDKVVILTRPESAARLEAFRTRGATVISIADYSSVPNVSKAFSGIEVVINTLSHYAFDLELPIAEAAKSADVQLFVPAEFGMATDNEGLHAAIAVKVELNKKIQALGLPTALFFTGGFADWLWSHFPALDVKSGRVVVGGDGNTKMSFTSRPDIGRYVAYVLTTLPPAQTQNMTFRIEGELTSFNEIFAAYEKKHGNKLEVKYIAIEELQAKLKENPRDVESILQLAWAGGQGVVGSPLDNDAFPDWNPKPVIHYL
ncbi:NAD-P-binding protein [Peniophora sp. CONT]|nr:NAD-P-binding protein [Peniophora sp. CONT]